MTNNYPKILTIAGSDSGGGAGIQADLKTFHALGTYGLSAITALTAQNTAGVYGIQAADEDFFYKQLDAVLSDISADAAKTGMLANAGIVKITAELLKKYSIKNIVIDPVMISKHGAKLLEEEAVKSYIKDLIPIADVITPNLNEAAFLTGKEKISTRKEMEETAAEILNMGCKTVVIKGGHLDESEMASDLFFNGEKYIWIETMRLSMKHTHGTGCTFSAAIAAYLGKGKDISDAVHLAKNFIYRAIETAFPVGKGIGPVNHLFMHKGNN